MAFTGELEHLHVVDIIQLLHTTRKSGTFSVRGGRGESRIIFSSGNICGANHLNNSVRIGTVLVKLNAITLKDLKEALEVQQHAGKARKPLIATLIDLGKLNREDASKGLRKLIEITIIELLGWTKGTFTVDTDDIAVTPECSYPIGTMEQTTVLDVQMVLMDALRIFDERERDRQSGKDVPSYEELFADMLSSEKTMETGGRTPVLTPADLGLADLDHLESRIPEPVSIDEVFDPAAIHRKKIKETLADFPDEDQDAFVSFLERSTTRTSGCDAPSRHGDRARALVLFSKDELIRHSVMTVCKSVGILVFTPDQEEELDHIIAQCLRMKIAPILVLDSPSPSGGGLSDETIAGLRHQARERHPQISILQLVSPLDYAFTLQSFRDGIRAALPRPSREVRRETFIADTVHFLETFKSYIMELPLEQNDPLIMDSPIRKLRDRVVSLRVVREASEVFLALLQSVSETFERSITFLVQQTELVGERALGLGAEGSAGPVSAAGIKIPLAPYSIFRDLVETGQVYFGESDDEVLREHLFGKIGAPLCSTVILIPIKNHGKVVALAYGDFGGREASPVPVEAFEILAHHASLVLENTLYRKQMQKTARK